MTAASPGRSPAAPGRSSSASSTRPLRAAARSSSGPEQPSTASAPARTRASCLRRRRARLWGQRKAVYFGVRRDGKGHCQGPRMRECWRSWGFRVAGSPLQQFRPQAMAMGKCEQLQARGDPHGIPLSLGHSQEACGLGMRGEWGGQVNRVLGVRCD